MFHRDNDKRVNFSRYYLLSAVDISRMRTRSTTDEADNARMRDSHLPTVTIAKWFSYNEMRLPEERNILGKGRRKRISILWCLPAEMHQLSKVERGGHII